MRTIPLLLLGCLGAHDDDDEDEDEAGDLCLLPLCNGDDTSDPLDDTGDTDTSSGVPLLQYVHTDCARGVCTWTADADDDIGTVELSLVETGDPAYEAECLGEVANGGLACGVWSEYHNNFQLVDDNNGFGGDTKLITLDVVTDPEDVVQNQTTLLDVDVYGEGMTVLWVITDSSGAYADCATYGDFPEYFAGDCENVW